jgi:hypothetical protein
MGIERHSTLECQKRHGQRDNTAHQILYSGQYVETALSRAIEPYGRQHVEPLQLINSLIDWSVGLCLVRARADCTFVDLCEHVTMLHSR